MNRVRRECGAAASAAAFKTCCGCFGRAEAMTTRLIVDSGGCLTEQNPPGAVKHDGSSIYKAAQPGAFAFLALYFEKHGNGSVNLVSRVNKISADHWVLRHAETMGLHWSHCHLVTTKWAKGPKVEELGGCEIVIDDNSECLYAVACHSWKTLKKAVLFNCSRYRQQGWWDAWLHERLTLTSSWRDVARLCEVDRGDSVWAELCQAGPPHAHLDWAKVNLALKPPAADSPANTQTKETGQEKKSRRRRVEEIAESPPRSEVDYGGEDDEPAKAKAKAQTVKDEPESDSSDSSSSSSSSSSTSAAKPPPPAAESKSTPPAAESTKPGPPALKLVAVKSSSKALASTEPTLDSASAGPHVAASATAKTQTKPAASATTNAASAGPRVAASATAKTKTKPAAAKATRPGTASGDEPAAEPETKRPASPKLTTPKPGSKPKPASRVVLKENPSLRLARLSEPATKSQAAAKWTQTPPPRRGSVAAAEPQQTGTATASSELVEALRDVTAALREAVPSPPTDSAASSSWQSSWQSWQGRRPESQWCSRKRQRAADHRAGAAATKPPTVFAVPLCELCRKNNPGASCPFKMCRPCCVSRAPSDSNCPQHG